MVGSLRQSINSKIGNIQYGMLIEYRARKLEIDVAKQVVGVIAEPLHLVIKHEKTTIRIVNA